MLEQRYCNIDQRSQMFVRIKAGKCDVPRRSDARA